MTDLDREQVAEGRRRERMTDTTDCKYPRWDTTDGVWICCHGGVHCGGCYAYPEKCKPPMLADPIDISTITFNDFSDVLYLAGPMSNIESFNYPAFHNTAKTLRDQGYTVINPAENHDGRTDLPLADYYRTDLPQVCDADAVAVLPGWEQSGGARIEVALARQLGKPVLDALTLEPVTAAEETILQEAQRLVHGDRGADYGHPIHDFARTGRIWAAILAPWAKNPDEPVPPRLVGLCMAGMKISREVNKPKRDNRVDAAGYMETVDMIEVGE